MLKTLAFKAAGEVQLFDKRVFLFSHLPPGLDGAGGQRHHQLQASSHPAARHPCQPVRLAYWERRCKDKGDQRGEHPDQKLNAKVIPRLK